MQGRMQRKQLQQQCVAVRVSGSVQDNKLPAESEHLALVSQDWKMDVPDIDVATAESDATDATTVSPTTCTSLDASWNQDQSQSQFVFKEEAPATSDSTPPSPQHISTANPPPIPGVIYATYCGYGFQEQFLQSVQLSMEDVRQGTSQRVVPQ